jgi:hypothetical protein
LDKIQVASREDQHRCVSSLVTDVTCVPSLLWLTRTRQNGFTSKLHVFLSLSCLLHVATLIVMFNFVTLNIFGEEWRVNRLMSCPQTSFMSHHFNACTVHLLLLCTMTNKCTQLFHKLSHCYMFRQYRVILRQPVISTLPGYISTSIAAVCNTIYN